MQSLTLGSSQKYFLGLCLWARSCLWRSWSRPSQRQQLGGWRTCNGAPVPDNLWKLEGPDMDRRASSDVGFKRDGRVVQLMESDVMHLYIYRTHFSLYFVLFYFWLLLLFLWQKDPLTSSWAQSSRFYVTIDVHYISSFFSCFFVCSQTI